MAELLNEQLENLGLVHADPDARCLHALWLPLIILLEQLESKEPPLEGQVDEVPQVRLHQGAGCALLASSGLLLCIRFAMAFEDLDQVGLVGEYPVQGALRKPKRLLLRRSGTVARVIRESALIQQCIQGQKGAI